MNGPAIPGVCPDCGCQLAPALLLCPGCRRLVFAEELKRLAAEATAAEAQGQWAASLDRWRSALALVPPETRQFAQLQKRIEELSRRVDVGAAAPSAAAVAPSPSWIKGSLIGFGAAGVLLWKFKALLLLLVGKGKLLLVGLTKASTMFSMLLSLGVYWAAWGWHFALGVIVSLYVHEMGHVAALQRFGIRASAPTFIPGFGALVRMKQHPANAVEDARVGLAGPLWGLGAALAAYGAFMLSGWPVLAAVARFGAWVNLFNLLPVMPLDGGRGFRALSRVQRWMVCATLAAMWFVSAEGLLLLLFVLAVARAFGSDAPAVADRLAFAQFVLLVTVLSAMTMIGVPHAPAVPLVGGAGAR